MEGVATKSLYRTTLKLQPYTDLLFLREKEKLTRKIEGVVRRNISRINHPEILNNSASSQRQLVVSGPDSSKQKGDDLCRQMLKFKQTEFN